jgi:hypothetical protein
VEVPFLCFTQQGDTYYLTPQSIYCFDLENAAHLYNTDIHENELGDQMHAHVSEEITESKGANNIPPLVMKTLCGLGLLTVGKKGEKLSFF